MRGLPITSTHGHLRGHENLSFMNVLELKACYSQLNICNDLATSTFPSEGLLAHDMTFIFQLVMFISHPSVREKESFYFSLLDRCCTQSVLTIT